MTENWQGQYTYGDTYTDEYKGRSVSFTISWDNTDGTIKGTCIDKDHPFGLTANIEGFIEENFISFIKTYPCYWEIDENNEPRIIRDKPSQVIHYSGFFTDDHFEGEWEIPFSYKTPDGDMIELFYEGIWTLSRC